MSIRDEHRKAMELVDQAHAALTQAYGLERNCAESLEVKPENEPTRSILYRSAGWIAFQRGYFYHALDCAELGLQGVLSPEIKTELLELKLAAEGKVGHAAPKMATNYLL